MARTNAAQSTEGDSSDEANVIFNAFKGHGSPRKSRKLWLHGQPDVYYRSKTRLLKQSISDAVREKSAQRLRAGRLARNSSLIKVPCMARASQQLDFTRITNSCFAAPATLIRPKPDKVYVLWLDEMPFIAPYISFTDAMEAFRSMEALKALGYQCSIR